MEGDKVVDRYKFSGGEICCVNGCKNSRRTLYQWGENVCEVHDGLLQKSCSCPRPFKLHYMPKNQEETRLQWLKAINRKTPPKKVIVCSAHFVDGKPTKENPIPQLNLGYKIEIKPGRKAPIKRKTLKNVTVNNKKVKTSTAIPDTQMDNECADNSIVVQTENMMCDKGTDYEVPTLSCDHSYIKPNESQSKKSVQTQTASRLEKTDIGVQCNIEDDESLAKHDIKNDTDAMFYTGVTYISFWTIVATLQKFNSFAFSLPLCDQIFLCLLRLRHAMVYEMLARKFKISRSQVHRIYQSWLDVMAEQLAKLVVWLPRETIKACLPKSFENYPKTTCIIDCAETFIQRFKHLRSRAETYSNYKGHNTAKYLVGIAPHGQIMFISRAYGGRCSDKYITNDSGFLDYLQSGDEIMADRGFTIQDLLFPMRVKLNIPAFTKGRKQLPAEEVIKTRRIANVRIHVERAIRRLKVFKIISGTVPVTSLKQLDKILIVCAALVNLRPLLIRDNIQEDK
jgi:hypothetical protein